MLTVDTFYIYGQFFLIDKQGPARSAGDKMSFQAKLTGILEVSGPCGDRICQEALSELKMAVKAAGKGTQTENYATCRTGWSEDQG